MSLYKIHSTLLLNTQKCSKTLLCVAPASCSQSVWTHCTCFALCDQSQNFSLGAVGCSVCNHRCSVWGGVCVWLAVALHLLHLSLHWLLPTSEEYKPPPPLPVFVFRCCCVLQLQHGLDALSSLSWAEATGSCGESQSRPSPSCPNMEEWETVLWRCSLCHTHSGWALVAVALLWHFGRLGLCFLAQYEVKKGCHQKHYACNWKIYNIYYTIFI